jgi:hypothetical protein
VNFDNGFEKSPTSTRATSAQVVHTSKVVKTLFKSDPGMPFHRQKWLAEHFDVPIGIIFGQATWCVSCLRYTADMVQA